MYMLHRLRGLGFTARVLEAGSGVGGTWYWNRYPGARCDVESVQYSYQFDDALQQEWDWTERYAAAARDPALRQPRGRPLRPAPRHPVQHARAARRRSTRQRARWTVETEAGERISARFCIMATGCLSSPNLPRFEGLDSFKGERYHTGNWPHEEVDFTGKRVAVIGTGSSAVQSIPIIAGAGQAPHRVPAHAQLRRARAQRSRSIRSTSRTIKADYPALRARAKQTMTGIDFDYSDTQGAGDDAGGARARSTSGAGSGAGLSFLGAFQDLMVEQVANDTAAEFVRGKIREKVRDPQAGASCCRPGTRSAASGMCIDIGYYETFNRENVELIDVSDEPIEAITAGRRAGQRAGARGRRHRVRHRLRCHDRRARPDRHPRPGGLRLQADNGARGRAAILGLAMAGFPNLFTITGPGSPSVLTNMLPTIEQHVEWIAGCHSSTCATASLRRIEPSAAAEDEWVAHGGRARRPHAALHLRLLVPGRQHSGQAARVHALYRRLPAVRRSAATRSLPAATRGSC